MEKVFWRDWLERTLWTLAQATISVIIVETADLDYWWVAPLAMVLAALKGLVASKIGNPETAAIGGNG